MAHKLRSKDFKAIGIQSDKLISISLGILKKHFKYHSKAEKIQMIQDIIDKPEKFINHNLFEKIANELFKPEPTYEEEIQLNEKEPELHVFGGPLIKANAYQQMKTALQLPVVKRAALMPDSHLGYGIPIGGVLATKQAIIPYAVGMDIGCRMSLTLYPVTERYFTKHVHKFTCSIREKTAFGIAKIVDIKQEHPFLDGDHFSATPLLRKLKSKAAKQLGSSGSGNHFVEWGMVELKADDLIGLPAGSYLGLLAHSGSRGFGASIAKFYTDLAKEQSNLPSNLRHLSWLDMHTDAGQEYWLSMNLAGDYAKACHDQVHLNVAKYMGLKPLCKIENHHNFAWKQLVDGQEMIVHRKGSTPAGKDVLGIIPGSMTDPGFIVKGKGNEDSLASASHGAGRKHSRKETIARNTRSEMRKQLRAKRITLIGGALDESPFAYKSLSQVMSFQQDLVEAIGTFQPRIVRMDKDK